MADALKWLVNIVNSIIEYIKELVSTIRTINDGKEEEPTE